MGRLIDLLGTTSLAVNAEDYDVIPVQQCGIRQINLRVMYNDAIINEVVVNYRDGGLPSEIDIDGYFSPDSSLGEMWLDLPGVERCVSDIVIIGRTVGDHLYDRQEASVEVFGERDRFY